MTYINGTNASGLAVPEGYKDIPEEDRKKARRFFDHAKTVAAAGQFDYAIEMFVSGLNLDPEDVEQHKQLRELSLKRKVSGGKGMGMLDKNKYPTATRDDKQNMLNAERLLTFDPGNIAHMIIMVQSAYRGGFYDTAWWMADILKRAALDAPRPEVQNFLVLKEIYRGLNFFKEASEMCALAMELRPGDNDLRDESRRLAAQGTIKDGNYDKKNATFRDSMRDKAGQEKLLEGERDVKSEDMLLRKARDCEKEWRATPEDMSKFNRYIEALKSTERMEQENVAIDELEKVFQATKQFKFRKMAGEIRMAQGIRMERQLKADYDADPKNVRKRNDLVQFHKERILAELEEFRMVIEHYPTDSTARYKMAERMFELKQYQDVIPVLQQVRHDPKYRAVAATLLARSFLEAGFTDEAVDIMKSAIDDYPTRGDEKFKDMTYWYGRSLEAKNEIALAIKQYSQVAQMEFKYKDVQDRIKRLRASVTGTGA